MVPADRRGLMGLHLMADLGSRYIDLLPLPPARQRHMLVPQHNTPPWLVSVGKYTSVS